MLKTYPINDLLLINQHIINFVFIADNFSVMCMLFCSYIHAGLFNLEQHADKLWARVNTIVPDLKILSTT